MIYTSVASTRVTGASLRALAEGSARRNERIGVTGLLLYGSGNYFQLIEGSQSTVKSLYRRISTDDRHHDVRLLFEAKIADRVFPDWHMGQLNLDEPGLNPADFWDHAGHPQSPTRSQEATARDQAIAWIRQFMEQVGAAA